MLQVVISICGNFQLWEVLAYNFLPCIKVSDIVSMRWLYSLSPVSKVNCPEAIITAHSAKHLVIPSLHSEGVIVEKNFLQSHGILHTTKVHTSEVVVSCNPYFYFTKSFFVNLGAGVPVHQCSSHTDSEQTCPGYEPELVHDTQDQHPGLVGTAWQAQGQ